MVLDEGQVLDGKYVIVRVLATGSMGEVYLGRNERIGKEVAVKVMRRDFADDRGIVNRFEQEARIATAVKSSHVVDVYDLGELPTGERFIVMEYVEGESLGARMAREGKLSARALGDIMLQILDGLIAAHDAGVVHRDLKPDNVILTKRDGQELVKLVDFGISKRSVAGAPRDPKRATLDGMLLGTPMFMSPEQARGESEGVDHRTDIFSAGVCMYEALSGEVPFNADNVVSLLARIMNEPEIPLEKRVPDIDPALAGIVKKAMAKDPKDRYQTAAEMREAVAAWYAIFASASAMRSSLEGVARVSVISRLSAFPSRISAFPRLSALPSYVDAVAERLRVFTADRQGMRVALGAAAVAALSTALVMRHPAEPAAAAAAIATTASAPTTIVHTTSDVLTVPTVAATATAPTTAVAPMVALPPPFEVTRAALPSPAVPVAVAQPKKSAIPAPVDHPSTARSARAGIASATAPAAAHAVHAARPNGRTDADAGAPGARDGGASPTRDAAAAAAVAPSLAKLEDAIPSAPTETPPPDPPATP